MGITEINILVVNYNTPDLLERLILSYYEYGYDEYDLHVVDGSDQDIFINETRKLAARYEKVSFDFIGKNIHHGPGLHYLINKYPAKYHLLMDSDARFKRGGFVEMALEEIDGYGVGLCVVVDERGFNSDEGYLYLHPNCCVISHKEYQKYKPMKRYGAPFIDTMIDLKGKEHLLKHIDLERFFDRGGRGTVDRFGYKIRP